MNSPVRRWTVLGVIAVGFLLLMGGWVTPASAGPTDNVVIIHVDDLGWRDLACMGSPVYETPHIDALAKSGTLFTHAYAAGSLCTPARACMLTGSQPSRHGVYTVVKNRGSKEQWKVIPENTGEWGWFEGWIRRGSMSIWGMAGGSSPVLPSSYGIPSASGLVRVPRRGKYPARLFRESRHALRDLFRCSCQPARLGECVGGHPCAGSGYADLSG